jgi:hypothetical protein
MSVPCLNANLDPEKSTGTIWSVGAMDDLSMLAERTPLYLYECSVAHVVDGDTLDVNIDLGFELVTAERVRLRGVDTAETHTVDSDSGEYERGKKHTDAVRDWVEEAREQNDVGMPFVLYSDNYTRSGFTRIIADLWSEYHGEWLTDFLRDTFDDIEYNG